MVERPGRPQSGVWRRRHTDSDPAISSLVGRGWELNGALAGWATDPQIRTDKIHQDMMRSKGIGVQPAI